MKNCLLLLVILLIPAWLFPQPLCGTDSIAVIRDENGIMTDKEQREAISAMFTKEGIGQLINTIKSEAEEIIHDGERAQHTASKTVVDVATMFLPGMQIGKAGKLAELTKTATDGMGAFKHIKNLNKKIDDLVTKSKNALPIKKAMKDFFGSLDPVIVEKLMEIDNFDGVLKEMVQSWGKFRGEKFVLEHISKQSDEFIKDIVKFEAKFTDEFGDEIGNFTTDILLKGGRKVEYKNWSEAFTRNYLKGEQATKQLKNYIKDGNFEYIFNKQKLLKNIADPDAFVKGEFQKVFKGKDADELFKAMPQSLKNTLGVSEDAIELTDSQLDNFLNIIIKVE